MNKSGSARDAVRDLIAIALKRGGFDNVTVACYYQARCLLRLTGDHVPIPRRWLFQVIRPANESICSMRSALE